MTRLAFLVLAGLMSACATAHHTPPAGPADPARRPDESRRAPWDAVSGEWSTVKAIGRGTELLVALQDLIPRQGTLEAVTGDALTVRRDARVRSYPRREIVWIMVRTRVGTTRTPHVLEGTVIGLMLPIAATPLALAWAPSVPICGGIGALVGAFRPEIRYRDRFVYIESAFATELAAARRKKAPATLP